MSSTSAPSTNPAAQLVFKYDVDEAVLRAMERGRFHELTNVESTRISSRCTKCRVPNVGTVTRATGDGTSGSLNAVALLLMQKKVSFVLNSAGWRNGPPKGSAAHRQPPGLAENPNGFGGRPHGHTRP